MNKPLTCLAFFLLANVASAQSVKQTPAIPTTTSGSQGAVAPNSVVQQGQSSFERRLSQLSTEDQKKLVEIPQRQIGTRRMAPPSMRQPPETQLADNYRIKIDHVIEGEASSFSTVTGKTKFSYQGFSKGVTIDGNKVPSTTDFEGTLSRVTKNSVFLDYAIGRTIPFVTGTFSGGPNSRVTSQYQQIQTGVQNGASFPLGKPVMVLQSEAEVITITITKMESD